MKWFKHISDASEDEFLVELEDIFGLEGYARYWKVLEAVARQMDETDRCAASYSWSKWQTILKGKRNKLDSFLVHCENKLKMNLKRSGNILEIKIPKLLELRDNYTKHLQAASNAPCKQEVDVEVEVDKEVKVNKKVYTPEFNLFWETYPKNKASKSDSFKSYQKALTKGATHDQLTAGAISYRQDVERTGTAIQYIAHATTWLNRERWTVEYDQLGRDIRTNGENFESQAGTGRLPSALDQAVARAEEKIERRFAASTAASDARRGQGGTAARVANSALLLDDIKPVREKS